MMGSEVREVWDDVAEAWDHREDELARLTGPLRERLLDRLGPHPGETVLELAAGTGALSRSLSSVVGSEGQVLCTDVAPRMVAAARRRASDAGLTNLRCEVMDAQDVGLPAGSVDRVVCCLGLMLMPRPDLALAECHRVLRPGGRLAFTAWGAPEDNPWLLLLGGALLQHGHVAQEDPMAPGGVFSLSHEDVVTEALGTAGFSDPALERVDLTHRYPSFEEYWQLHTATGGPIARVLAGLDAAERDRVRATCREFAAGFASDGGLVIPGQAVIATASAA